MRRIEIEIPDWVEENVYIVAGNECPELIGVIPLKQGWKTALVKIERCGRCGTCCHMPWIQNLRLPVDDDGLCVYATKDDEGLPTCSLKGSRPWGCCIGEPKTEEDVCQTRWREVDDDHPPRKLVLMKTPRK
ncbi:MAG: hypothetical protein ACYSW3_00290 [Planctomycetota bacterium]